MDERGGTSKVREQHSVENGGRLKEKDTWSQILEILVGTDEEWMFRYKAQSLVGFKQKSKMM